MVQKQGRETALAVTSYPHNHRPPARYTWQSCTIMLWRTHFESITAEYSVITNAYGGKSTTSEAWRSAKVYISEVTQNKRKYILASPHCDVLTCCTGWLIVVVEPDATPVIWSVILQTTTLACDEVMHPPS